MDRDKAIINKQFCCPKCKGELSRAASFDLDRVAADAAFGCNRCSAVYPIIGGIPDFRVYADPYIDINADRKKGLLLADKARRMSFADLVAFYYSITPEVPDDLARYYFNHHLAGTTRGAGLLRRLTAYGIPLPDKDSSLLDLGCGTSGFLSVASKLAGKATGVDIAFRWLIVAKEKVGRTGLQQRHSRMRLRRLSSIYRPPIRYSSGREPSRTHARSGWALRGNCPHEG